MNRFTAQKIGKKLANRTWWIQVFNGLPFYITTVAFKSGWSIKRVCGTNFSHFLLVFHGHSGTYYYDEADLIKIGQGYYTQHAQLSTVKPFIKEHGLEYKKAKHLTGKIPKNLNFFSLRELVGLSRKLISELTLSINMTHVIEGISFVSEIKLKEILERCGAHTTKNFHLLSSPTKPSFLSLAQIALWKIKNANGIKKKKLIEQYLKNFSWVENNYVKAQRLNEKQIITKAEMQKSCPDPNDLRVIKKEKTELVKALRLKPAEKFVVQTTEICTNWQDNRKKFLMQTIERFEPVLEEISRRIGLPLETVKFLSPDELTLKNLQNKNFLYTLRKRNPHSAYYGESNTIHIFCGHSATLLEDIVKIRPIFSQNEIKGLTASPGKVMGKIKICLTLDDIPLVKSGEILVASMTRPEFLPAMQKAAAFVTDEGGITSHAAIVSREMKKPCIIGTKFATKVFKDGDFVEVDANKGIVRKI